MDKIALQARLSGFASWIWPADRSLETPALDNWVQAL